MSWPELLDGDERCLMGLDAGDDRRDDPWLCTGEMLALRTGLLGLFLVGEECLKTSLISVSDSQASVSCEQ